MGTLKNVTRKKILARHIEKANGLFARMKGLMGRSGLDPHHALWISHCNSVHTFFMKFSIDVIFVDKHLVVKSINRNIKPGQIIWPIWGASSVFEFSSGVLLSTSVEKGDHLYVEP